MEQITAAYLLLILFGVRFLKIKRTYLDWKMIIILLIILLLLFYARLIEFNIQHLIGGKLR